MCTHIYIQMYVNIIIYINMYIIYKIVQYSLNIHQNTYIYISKKSWCYNAQIYDRNMPTLDIYKSMNFLHFLLSKHTDKCTCIPHGSSGPLFVAVPLPSSPRQKRRPSYSQNVQYIWLKNDNLEISRDIFIKINNYIYICTSKKMCIYINIITQLPKSTTF